MKALSKKQAKFLLAIAPRIVPDVKELDAQGQEIFLGIIDGALMVRSRALRRQFASFLSVMRLLPILRYGAPLDKLSPSKQDKVIGWFQDSPSALLRRGLWGLKALIFMGYYGQPGVYEKIKFTPVLDGNERLHG